MDQRLGHVLNDLSIVIITDDAVLKVELRVLGCPVGS